jgi:hypothetical protein
MDKKTGSWHQSLQTSSKPYMSILSSLFVKLRNALDKDLIYIGTDRRNKQSIEYHCKTKRMRGIGA